MAHEHGKGMLVLIGGLLVVSFLYFVSVMKKDEEASQNERKSERSNETNTNSQTSSPDVTNMECSQSSPKFVCSICGSRTMTIKIEEKIEESTTTTTIIEENCNFLPFNNSVSVRRVPFPEAGVDIVDRKLKNTEESLEKEIDEYRSNDNDILTYTESWTDNWLFRKKENNNNKRDNVTSASFKPVSMFVPNTSAKYRAMIGDQNVDEISDLSDDHCSSNDSEEEEDDDATKTKRSKVGNGMAKYIYDQRSRVFIDGKSKHHIEELCLNNEEATTNLPSSRVVSSSVVVVRSLDHPNTNSHCPRETDVEGKNVSTSFNLTALNDDATNENSVKSNSRSYYRSELFIETRDVNQNSSLPLLPLACDDKLLSDVDFNLFSPPKPGTIADREHRKWQTAVPMENNPYSEENLQKRLIEKKYTPSKYSSASSLLGIARINGLDDGIGSCVDSISTATGMIMKNDIDFQTIDLLPEKSSVSRDNDNTPIIESDIVRNTSAKGDKSIVTNYETKVLPEKSNISCNNNNNTPIIVESKKTEIINCKSSAPENTSHIKESKVSHDIVVVEEDEHETKNKSVKSKYSNSLYAAIEVTKKNATTINEVDYSSSSSSSSLDKDEKISLPSVKKLVEVFSQKQREIAETLNKPKDKNNTSDSEQQKQQHKFERPKFKRIERTLQQSPRPLHLHSLTARSLSKEFREGLR